MMIRLSMQIHEENGSLWTEVEELPGCFVQGRDLDELVQAVAEAVPMYLEDDLPQR